MVTGHDITGLAGVIVWTPADGFGAMRDFYVHTLGLTPRSDRDGFVNFDWDRTRLTVAVHDGVAGTAADPLRIMVNLEVGDITAVHARLAAAGVVFTRPPEREPWGGTVATFADPDGNTLQLLAMPS